MSKIKDGMAEKVSTTIQYVSMAIAGLIVGLAFSWKVALVTLAVSPLLVVSTALMLKVSVVESKTLIRAAYSKLE